MLAIPERILGNWASWWPDEDLAALAADVLARGQAAMEELGLADPRPLGGGEVAFVMAVRSPRGEAVLKVIPGRDARAGDEGRALAAWGERGAAVPRVIALRDEGRTMLLARVAPGRPLGEVVKDPVAVARELGGLAASLRALRPPRGHFPHLGNDMALAWRHDLAGLPEQAELEELLAGAAEPALLHLDLHAGNALQGGRGFVMIDPKPQLGDPHAEGYGLLAGPPAEAMSGRARDDRRLMARMLDTYAQGLDVGRLTRWTRVRAAALHREALREDAGWAAELARSLSALRALDP